jgi:hypothetical protein
VKVNVGNKYGPEEILPSGTSALSTTASPTSLPPVTRAEAAPGIPFRSNTLAMIFVTAMAHNGVVGEGFQTFAFPAAKDNEKFLSGHQNGTVETTT